MTAENDNKRQSDFFDTCGHCKTSYSCCNDTTPPITVERRKIIENFLKEKGIAIKDPFVKTEYVFPRLNADGFCIFHDKKTRKCLIHPVKPETCVAGPITFDINAKNRTIEWYVKTEKICQLAKTVYADKRLLQKHLRSAKKEILKLVKELESQDLKAILKKAEPETFKIDEDKAEKNVIDKVD